MLPARLARHASHSQLALMSIPPAYFIVVNVFGFSAQDIYHSLALLGLDDVTDISTILAGILRVRRTLRTCSSGIASRRDSFLVTYWSGLHLICTVKRRSGAALHVCVHFTTLSPSKI